MNVFGRCGSVDGIRRTLWLFILLTLAGLSVLMVPIQSPDENSHLARAYLLSRGELLLQDFPAQLEPVAESPAMAIFFERARLQKGRMGGMVDQGLLRFINGYMELASKPDRRLTDTEQKRLAELEWTGRRDFTLLPGTGYYFPAIYAPHALGFGLGQWMSLSVAHSYQLVRGLTLLVCLVMLWRAFQLLMPSPAVMALLMLPMSVFQLLSPTLDGLTTSLAVLAISIFLRNASLGGRHSAGASWSLAVCVFLLATTRAHLLVLLALPFFLAWRSLSIRDFCLGCGAALAAFAWTGFALGSTTDVRIVRQQGTVEMLLLYAADPMAFLRVVWVSVTDPEFSTFYQKSFIGILGWLDAPLAKLFYPVLWAGLGLCVVMSLSFAKLSENWQLRVLLLGLALISVGGIFLALLATWTPHPALLVHGVQGRYFVVPALMLAYAMSALEMTEGSLRHRMASVTTAGFAVLCISALTLTLFGRYH